MSALIGSKRKSHFVIFASTTPCPADRNRKHLMEDISPYTCIVDDCPHPDLLHRSRRAWMQHVERDHHQCWECLPCKTPERVPLLFSSVEELISHTRQVHNDSIKEDQYATLAAAASRIAPSGISQCPLCNETGTADSDALFDHIAEHVHSFSLYSLPWPKDENDDLDEASYDYFQDNDFFDTGEVAGSDDSTLSTDSQGSSGLGSLPSNRDLARPRLTLEIPDQPVRKLKFSLEVGFPRETPDSSSQVSPVSENDSEPVTDHYLGRPEKKKSFPIPETDSFKVVILGPEICVNQVLRNGSLKPISAEDEGQFIASWVRWQPSTEWATGPPRTFIMSGYSAVDDYSDVSLTKRALSRTRDVLSRTGRALLGSRFERRKPEPEAPLVRYGPLSPRTLVPLYGPRLTDSFKEVVSGPDLCSGQILVNGLLAPEPEWEEDPQRLIWAKWEPFLTWQARSTYQNHSTRKLYY